MFRVFIPFVVVTSLVLTKSAEGKPPFSERQLESLPAITKKEVDLDSKLFIYDGLVYRLDKFGPDGVIPISHVKKLDKLKKKDSTVTKLRVTFHNSKLKEFLMDFENVAGKLDQ